MQLGIVRLDLSSKQPIGAGRFNISARTLQRLSIINNFKKRISIFIGWLNYDVAT